MTLCIYQAAKFLTWQRGLCRDMSSGGGFGRGRARRRGGQTRERPKPVKIGDIINVEIKEVSRRGDGVARVSNFVVFVPGTKPGDRVNVRIERVGSTYAVGKVVAEEE